jgi:hypothetical protein
MPAMRRLGLAFLVVAFCSAFQSSGFSGCGGSAPPAADLPPGETLDCFSDLECEVAGGCRMMSCIAGACVDTGPIDLDFDGVSGGTCGDDCDDFDSSRYPGALEYCDGLDQDCDEVVDEDATPTPTPWSLGATNDPAPDLAPLGTGLVAAYFDGSGFGVTIVALDRFGAIRDSALLLSDDVVYEHEIVAGEASGGATVLAIVHDRMTLAVLDVTAELGIGAPTEVPVTIDADRLEAIRYPGGLAATWVEGDTDVRLWTSEMAAPVTVGTLSEGAPDLAFDGARIVVSIPVTEAVFVDPATGAVDAMRVLDGRTWAQFPLASDAAGEPFALLRDAFDHAVTPFSETGTLGRTPAPSVSDRSMPGRIDVLGDRVVITRLSSGSLTLSGLTMSILDGDLNPRFSFDPSTLGSIGGPTYGWDVALHEDFTAAVVAFDGSAYGFTLACGL